MPPAIPFPLSCILRLLQLFIFASGPQDFLYYFWSIYLTILMLFASFLLCLSWLFRSPRGRLVQVWGRHGLGCNALPHLIQHFSATYCMRPIDAGTTIIIYHFHLFLALLLRFSEWCIYCGTSSSKDITRWTISAVTEVGLVWWMSVMHWGWTWVICGGCWPYEHVYLNHMSLTKTNLPGWVIWAFYKNSIWLI